MKIKTILSALLLMASTMASAQYLNVKLEDGTYRSFKTTPNMKVTFGEKKEEVGTINGHAYVELAGYKWATENVANCEKGLTAIAADPTYGLYYAQEVSPVENAKQAAESWGSTWKLPTEAQWTALLDENNCTWEWQTRYSFNGKTMNGYKVSDKNDASKFIFLPAAGIYDDNKSHEFNNQGYRGRYWSADHSKFLLFVPGYRSMDVSIPNDGMAVRPVSE